MIRSIKAKSSRRLLLLLISFAMLSFMTACGGTLDSATTTGGEGSISLSASTESLPAGKSSILTATVTDSTGGFVKGQAVAFSFVNNKSGGSISSVNGGITDSTGTATAVYTSGSNDSNLEVQDNIQASISGSSRIITITRESTSTASTSYHLTLNSTSTSAAAGENIIFTAYVTDGSSNPVSGQAVSFALFTNNSGASLTIIGTGVSDNDGSAQAIYKAGSNSPDSSVTDIILVSITGSSVSSIITRSSAAQSSTGNQLKLSADSVSLTAGNSTLVRATVTTGGGTAVVGTTVTFSMFTNNSGASLVALNGGVTDASGTALATYKAGSNNSTSSVQDIIQASVTGSTGAIIITRASGSSTSTGLTLTLSANPISLAAGEHSLVTATVTSGSATVTSGSTTVTSATPVAGQTVTFSFVSNPNSSTLSSYTATTDASGQATTVYTAGSATASTAQDVLQASVTGSNKAIIITKTGSAVSTTAAYLDITATPLTIGSDGSTISTITVYALNSNYAELQNIEVTVGASTSDSTGKAGVLSASTVTAPGTVTLSCGSNKDTRTVTVTASADGCSPVQIPIQVSGSAVTMTSSGTSVSDDGSNYLTLTVKVKDSAGNVVKGVPVTLTPSTVGLVSISNYTPSSGYTDSNGKVTAKVTGVSAGTLKITAGALNETSDALPITVAATGNQMYIYKQQLCGSSYPTDCTEVTGNPETSSMTLSQKLEVQVYVPSGVSSITFSTTVGKFVDSSDATNNGSTITVAKDAYITGYAVAYLTSDNIGVAGVEVLDASNNSDSLSVTISSDNNPDKIFLQASPTVLPIKVGTTAGSSTVTATVYDASNYPLVNKWVAFSIVATTSTSGGETLSPSLALTDSNGQAIVTFTSGTASSASSGVRIHAQVVGTDVETEPVGVNLTDSGNDVAIVIGGEVGSIAFGQATVIAEDSTTANYVWAMSVLVADANGNAVDGAVVSLSVWPIAFCTGVTAACTCDADNGIDQGTFWNEDKNENLILDPGEDGTRCYYADPTRSTCVAGGTKDGLLTPTNSRAGSLPSTKTTDSNGVAGFNLTYPKQSAIWTFVRIRATTTVQGSETSAQIILQLPIKDTDVCKIQCPYTF